MPARKLEMEGIVGCDDRHPVQLAGKTHKRLMDLASELKVHNANMAVAVLLDHYEGKNGGGMHN
jgi:hypothetical protein